MNHEDREVAFAHKAATESDFKRLVFVSLPNRLFFAHFVVKLRLASALQITRP